MSEVRITIRGPVSLATRALACALESLREGHALCGYRAWDGASFTTRKTTAGISVVAHPPSSAEQTASPKPGMPT